MGPKTIRSTVLSAAEEAAIVAFRKYSLLLLDETAFTPRKMGACNPFVFTVIIRGFSGVARQGGLSTGTPSANRSGR
jgi:hypothetical protein